jgi:hypothetical protein
VHFTDSGLLAWPVIFLYPEHGETDFVEEFVEDQAFADHVEAMFGQGVESPPWDKEGQYKADRLKLYFEDNTGSMPKLVPVDKTKILREVLTDKRYSVMGGTPGFIVVVNKSPFHIEFVKKYE